MFLVTSLRPNPKPPDEIRDAADAAAAQVDPTPISDLTRMKADAWRAALDAGGPDSYSARFPDEARRILEGIASGVPIDFRGDRSKPRFGKNRKLPEAFMDKIRQVIDADVASLKKAGPYSAAPFPVMAELSFPFWPWRCEIGGFRVWRLRKKHWLNALRKPSATLVLRAETCGPGRAG